MIVLVSAAMVIIAAVLVVIELIRGGGFGLVYAAIALAAGSMVLLQLAKWTGSRPEPRGPDRPEPLAAEPEPVAEPDPERGAAGPTLDPEDGFPIADYDTLWVSQILPLLPRLYPPELAVVEARERGGRHRPAVLDAIAALRVDAVPTPTPTPTPTPAPKPAPAIGPADRADRDEPMEHLELAPEPPATDDRDLVSVAADGELRVPTFLGHPRAPIVLQWDEPEAP